MFLFLLPVFFVFHGFTENFSAIPARDCLYLLVIYLAATTIVFFISWLFYRNVSKAALVSLLIMAFHFFFGGIQDMLKKTFDDAFFTRYSFILPFFLAMFTVIIIGLKKRKKEFSNLNFYLNILFCLLLFIDIAWLVQKVTSKQKTAPVLSSAEIPGCNDCVKPDIYFLVFDEYSSSTALKELWNFDNTDLDSFLTVKGFTIQSYSKSNYNFTPFSIASTLNMDYLSIPNPKACDVRDYSECFSLIKKNRVCSVLESLGYKIVNYSIFDLDKNPSPVEEDFLPLKTRLITSQTFLSRIKKDLLYHLLTGRFELPWLTKNMIYSTYNNNEKIIAATLKESKTSTGTPRFIYSHIEMPHPPFYYNSRGKQTDERILIEENNKLTAASYLGYIPRTNQVVKEIVSSIMTHAKRPAIIILIGDHGFRSTPPETYHFRNQNAVYVSFKKEKWFYPGISNVNEFRVLFNNLFHASYPLLRDSTSFLIDK